MRRTPFINLALNLLTLSLSYWKILRMDLITTHLEGRTSFCSNGLPETDTIDLSSNAEKPPWFDLLELEKGIV